MALRFVGRDPESQGGNCPTVMVDEVTFDLVIQGAKVDPGTAAEAERFGPLPEFETVIRIPVRMVPLIREACNVAERQGLPGAPGSG